VIKLLINILLCKEVSMGRFKRIKKMIFIASVVYTVLTVVKFAYLSYSAPLINEPEFKTNNSIQCAGEIILGPYYKEEVIKTLYEHIERAEATLIESDIKEAEQSVNKTINLSIEPFILKYLQARVYYIWGHYYLDKGNNKLAKDFIEKSLSFTEESIGLNGNFSDSQRLAGDIYGELIDLKIPMIYGPIYGPKADKLVKKAKEINPQNPEVYLAMGRKYLFTPSLFGGSKKKAIESFNTAKNICPSYYQVYLWLGKAHQIRGEINLAKESFQKVLSLLPESKWAKDELKELEEQDEGIQ